VRTNFGVDFVIRPIDPGPSEESSDGISPDQVLRPYLDETGGRVEFADPDPVQLPSGAWRVFVGVSYEGTADYLPYSYADGDQTDGCVGWEDMFASESRSHRASLDFGTGNIIRTFAVTIRSARQNKQ
jgi:hypothetical protein